MKTIAVEICNSYTYPDKDNLFRPSERYPEYPSQWEISDEINVAYACVRNALIRMNYDKENFGTSDWNPLSHLIKEGDTILIKPNFVHHRNGSGDTVECLYTQPSVIAAVLDYVSIALHGTGKIIVGDAPMQECDFDELVKQSGLDDMVNFYCNKGIDVELADFRAVLTNTINGVVHYKEKENTGKVIDLGKQSEFSVLSAEENLRLRKGANDPEDLHKHHHAGKHEYEVCGEMLQADVIIDMPKPKLHMKAGVTISLKNMVGVNVRKEFLPHHMEGDKQSQTGDAYEKKNIIKKCRSVARDKAYVFALQKKYMLASFMTLIRRTCALLIKLFAKDKLTEGTWCGNETISKTVIDLNKIVRYADKSGRILEYPQRKRLIVADMIVSGEGRGPISPTSKKAGMIAIGEDAVCFDECIATIMGADVRKIPTLVNARNTIGTLVLTENENIGVISSNNPDWNGKTYKDLQSNTLLNFKPIDSWKEAFN